MLKTWRERAIEIQIDSGTHTSQRGGRWQSVEFLNVPRSGRVGMPMKVLKWPRSAVPLHMGVC